MKFTVIILIVAAIFTAWAQKSDDRPFGYTHEDISAFIRKLFEIPSPTTSPAPKRHPLLLGTCLQEDIECLRTSTEIPPLAPFPLDACSIRDIECVRNFTEIVLQRTAAGIPQLDIKPIDPLVIDNLSVHSTEFWIFHFTNMIITGLKNMKIVDFKTNTTDKTVLISSKEDVTIVSDVVIQVNGINFTGKYTAKANAIETDIRYNYEITNFDIFQYYKIGPELITCEAKNEPEVTLSSGLEQSLQTFNWFIFDQNVRNIWNDYYSNKAKYRKEAICNIIKYAFRTIAHNIREAAKETFFKN